jgi:hypothetical protein
MCDLRLVRVSLCLWLSVIMTLTFRPIGSFFCSRHRRYKGYLPWKFHQNRALFTPVRTGLFLADQKLTWHWTLKSHCDLCIKDKNFCTIIDLVNGHLVCESAENPTQNVWVIAFWTGSAIVTLTFDLDLARFLYALLLDFFNFDKSFV